MLVSIVINSWWRSLVNVFSCSLLSETVQWHFMWLWLMLSNTFLIYLNNILCTINTFSSCYQPFIVIRYCLALHSAVSQAKCVSVNGIILLMESVCLGPKMILLSCTHSKSKFISMQKRPIYVITANVSIQFTWSN